MMQVAPIAEWPRKERAEIAGIFSDIDDTLTTDGRVPSAAFDAMERLREAGLLVVPVTGRPAGWCDMIARTWPVDGVVGENGALAFRYDAEGRRMERLYTDPPDLRADKMRRLATIREEVMATVEGAGLSADQAYRETDLAIDFAEDVAPLDDEAIEGIVAIFEKHGATARVSSIHVNGWFGEHSKLSMTKRMMSEFFNVDLEAAKSRYVFIGDSPNDAPMFGYFPSAVGVANLNELAYRCEPLPTWITHQPRTSGFIEMAETLLSAKSR
jgi:HAD superfamily hydrolase (TIGR01484 family)